MLNNVAQPYDIRNKNSTELNDLAKEIRKVIIDTVSQNGGHLASNLGIVEATIAIHRVFDSPNDKIIFDVGHQCYAHKLLTGRYDDFASLRKFEGISGFTSPKESVHDVFYEGHCGTSVSAALGIATAFKLEGNPSFAVAVVGDGALTNGMIYEALNNCSNKALNLIIIVNDNEMSISRNVGGLHNYLSRIRTSRGYFTLKRKLENVLTKIPLIGCGLAKACKCFKDFIKRLFIEDTIFEDLGLIYLGPVDGHDIDKMISVLNEAKSKGSCCVIHMKTQKGKGYTYSESQPHKYHSVGSFNLEAGVSDNSGKATFSEVFGETMVCLADEEPKLCAITAAMCEGTGLGDFAKQFPERFFDVGIAEEHAITFASGLSAAGMKPVVALYSTFSQRVYDQLFHDVALQNLPMIITLDRAGIVPHDGITHQGIYDYAMFTSIPNVNVFAPADGKELFEIVKSKVQNYNDISIIRYPKATADSLINSENMISGELVEYTKNVFEASVVILTYGRLSWNALRVSEKLNGVVNAAVVRLKKIFPLDFALLKELLTGCRLLYILDESYTSGSVGEKLQAHLNIDADIIVKDIKSFVTHGDITSLMSHYGFTDEEIEKDIKQWMDKKA